MCTCATKQRTLKANLLAGEAKRTTYEGRPTLVVPVVMARADVVMNGGIIPVEEMVPHAWNGVPVTVGHPQASDGTSLAVGDPQVLTEWSVGRIFGAHVSNGILRAQAWLDITRAERVYPGLIERLEAGENIDVSTGYFTTPEAATGNVGGRQYTEIHRELRPEHLALLPGEAGACDWEDGCGVRSNLRKVVSMKIDDAVAALRKAVDGMAAAVLRTNSKKGNRRGSDDDRRQIMADLISSDESPFTPEDEDSLRMMSNETLAHMRDSYLKKAADDEPEPKDDPPADADEPKDKDMTKNAKANGITKADLDAAVKAAVSEALKTNALSDDDKAALADAKKARTDRKANLVAKVVANSAITKEQAEAMDFATLETVANGILPPAIYGGRAAPVTNADAEDDDVKAMSEFNGDAAITKAINAKRERLAKAH